MYGGQGEFRNLDPLVNSQVLLPLSYLSLAAGACYESAIRSNVHDNWIVEPIRERPHLSAANPSYVTFLVSIVKPHFVERVGVEPNPYSLQKRSASIATAP